MDDDMRDALAEPNDSDLPSAILPDRTGGIKTGTFK